MADVLQLTQSCVEPVPSTSTSTLSNTSSLKGSLKSKGANENKISAPAGREIINLSRRRLYIGRAGAGNAMSSQTTPDRQQKVRELLVRDREVLESYKAQVPMNYNTGRGGAGAKGHLKVKGKVPNRERALAKEREVQAKWREERDKTGSLKTGRGGRGNIVKVASNDDTSSMAPSRVESRDSSLNLGRPLSAFGTTSSEKRRRRHFSLNQKPLSSRPGSSHSYYTAQGDSRAPSSATNRWDPTSDTDSSYDLESAGIMTSKADPSAFVGSPNSGQSTTRVIAGAQHTSNEVAPIEERAQPRRLQKLSLKTGHKPSIESGSSTTSTTSPHPNSLLRPFKKLYLPKTHEIEAIPASVVIDISASSPSTHHYAEPPVSSNIDTSTLVYPYRTDWAAASNALQMVNPSHRTFIPPPRILTPPPPPAPPTTPAQRSLPEDLESASETGYDSSPTSDTFGSITTHANQSFLTTSPSTPVRSGPPKLPALYFQESVPPRGTDIRWSKRPLPIPPVSTHTVLRPLSTHSGLPSPPETPVGAEFESDSVTPTASPSSYHTARLPPSPFSYSLEL